MSQCCVCMQHNMHKPHMKEHSRIFIGCSVNWMSGLMKDKIVTIQVKY